MNAPKKHDSVTLPNGRTGIVVEVDNEKRKAFCGIDPTEILASGPHASRWFEFDELTLRAISIPD
jgi:hypothetical protein